MLRHEENELIGALWGLIGTSQWDLGAGSVKDWRRIGEGLAKDWRRIGEGLGCVGEGLAKVRRRIGEGLRGG